MIVLLSMDLRGFAAIFVIFIVRLLKKFQQLIWRHASGTEAKQNIQRRSYGEVDL